MRVILLRDVAKIGRQGDVCEVPDGHALNFLIPRKLAEIATKEALKRHSGVLKQKEVLTDRSEDAFGVLFKLVGETGVTVKVQANEQGHLFRGIHEKDIVDALLKEGHVVSEKEVLLPSVIKSIGDVPVTLTRGKRTGTLTIHVVRE